jgi:hypothetical protein
MCGDILLFSRHSFIEHLLKISRSGTSRESVCRRSNRLFRGRHRDLAGAAVESTDGRGSRWKLRHIHDDRRDGQPSSIDAVRAFERDFP